MQTPGIIDLSVVFELRDKLYGLMREAKDVSSDQSYVRIESRRTALNKAIGLFETLEALKLIDDPDLVKEDLERIDQKIQYVRDEKRRKMGFG